MIAGQFMGKGSLFLSVMLLSRYLSDSDFGVLLFAVALGQVYLIFSDMGLSLVLNMRASVRPEDTQELLSASTTMKVALGILGLPVLVMAGAVLGMSGNRLLVLGVVGISVLLESFAEMYYSVFRARERMLSEGISRISKGITGLALVMLATRFGADLLTISFTYVVRAMVAVFVAIAGIRRLGYTVKPRLEWNRARELFVASLPLGIMGLVTVAHQKADTMILMGTLGENAVAAWQQCLRITEFMLLLVVPTLLPGALFPGLCRSFRDGRSARETGDMARVFTAFAAAAALGAVSTGERFLRFIWGSEYLRSFSSSDLQLNLYLCLAGLAVLYLVNILLTSLLAVNKVKVVVPVTSAALVLIVAGNIHMIPKLGLRSVGVFYLIGNLLVLVSYWLFLKLRGFSLPVFRESGLTLLVALPFFALTPLTGRLPFVPALLLPVILFFLAWSLTGGLEAAGRLFNIGNDAPLKVNDHFRSHRGADG